MSISDVLFSIFLALGTWPIGKSGFCEMQGFGVQFGFSTVAWTGVLAVNFFLHVVKILHDDFLMKYYKYYHLAGWGPALLFSVIAASGNMYGNAGVWCWIDGEDHEIWRFLLWYIPLWIVFIINSILIVWVAVHLWSFLEDENIDKSDQRRARRVIMQSFGFLVIFVIIWTPATINRLYQLITDERSFTLSFLHVLFVPLQGAGNFVVYVGPIFYSHIVAYRKGEKGTARLFTLQSARPSVGARRETEESLSFDIRDRMSTTVGPGGGSYQEPVRLQTLEDGTPRNSVLSDVDSLAGTRASALSVALELPDAKTQLGNDPSMRL